MMKNSKSYETFFQPNYYIKEYYCFLKNTNVS